MATSILLQRNAFVMREKARSVPPGHGKSAHLRYDRRADSPMRADLISVPPLSRCGRGDRIAVFDITERCVGRAEGSGQAPSVAEQRVTLGSALTLRGSNPSIGTIHRGVISR